MNKTRIRKTFASGLAWSAVMFIVAVVFLGLKHVLASVVGSQGIAFIGDDHWLSTGILVGVAFCFGCISSWAARRTASTAP